MSKSIQWLKYAFELRFLPVRFQRWLFGTGTRAVEFVSGCSMIGYALVFAFSPNDIYNWPQCTGRHSKGKFCRAICC